MFEFLIEAIRPANLPFTALLGMVTAYWGLVCLGALDFESEPALHAGSDVGADAHLGGGDGHLEGNEVVPGGGADGLTGTLKAVLQFLNFGDVPAMIVVSVMTLSLWTFSMIGNHYFSDGSMGRTILLLAPNLVLTAVITRIATSPLKKLFAALNREYDEHKPVAGRTCVIMSSEVTDKFGQAQVETAGAPLLINVRTYGDAKFTRGEAALIIKEDQENNLYTVAKLTTTPTQQEPTL